MKENKDEIRKDELKKNSLTSKMTVRELEEKDKKEIRKILEKYFKVSDSKKNQ